MRRIGAAVLSAAFLVGMLATSAVHVHPAGEHEHGAHDHHPHESLLHAHLPGCRDSDPAPHVADGDHGTHDAAAIYLSCDSVTPRTPSAMPGMLAVIVSASDNAALRSSVVLTRVTHPRAPPYLIGPSLRGPPPA